MTNGTARTSAGEEVILEIMLRSTQRKDVRASAQYQCDAGRTDVHDGDPIDFIRHIQRLAVDHHGRVRRTVVDALEP